ncbi:hypothetical protein TRFO_37991 [Tritrichomonas foetus]|uniref:Uncharacterized protein n=1 Tax=Tritrichomonas foetus TaxID=1144522 RepID=A0A1J4JB63_9EUKA|nr:hypothetical protein TRFO_37991 [Tritrichomonas foetus]|eukprot:OHS95913.1 hypothetical protein TRFO_37991 [Tritrichomonas foetus]
MVKRKNLQRYEERLDFFYNFVLSKIPQNAWFIKLDADNIYSKDNLQKLMEVPKNDYDIACLPYLNLYCDTTYRVPFYIYNGNQIVKNVCDHWLLKNFGCYFELVDQDDNSSYEILKTKEERHEIFVSIQALHFPFQKTRRNNWAKGAKMSKIYIRNKNRPKIDGTKCSKSLCSYQNLYQVCKEISKQSSYLYHCWWWLQDNFLSIIEEISQLIQQTQFIFTFVFLLWYLFRILYERLHPRNCRKPSKKAEKEPLLLRTNDDEFLIGN